MSFQLDTSGYVASDRDLSPPLSWSDLSPFAQGYVEAMFAGLSIDLMATWLDTIDPYRKPAFRDLSPSALALILEDCEAACSRREWRDATGADHRASSGGGAGFWSGRNTGAPKLYTLAGFPPLLPSLDEEGKVQLSVKGG